VHAFAAAQGKPGFFMFGEVYDGSDRKCGSYTGTKAGGPFALDSVLDYPLYFKTKSVFAQATGNTKQLEDRYAAITANYDPCAQMRLVTFLDNHDQPRFLSAGSANNNTDRLKVALAFLYTARGIPCLYYGTEQAFNGGNDPYDREDMFAGQFEQGPSVGDNFNMTHPLFQWVAKLNNLRRLYPALHAGVHSNKWGNPNGPGLFAYTRRLGTQEVFVVLNTAKSSQTLPERSTLYHAGTRLVNLLDTKETATVTVGPRTPPITVPGTAVKVFIGQAQMLPLDPVVTSITPAHDSTNAGTTTPIVIRFSQPMDTRSVESAFSTIPAATGSFTWSAARDTMTFTPGGAGLPAQSMISVRIAANARTALSDGPLGKIVDQSGDWVGTASEAAAGGTFYSAFEARFKTGPAAQPVR
jgi:hypothetical protein